MRGLADGGQAVLFQRIDHDGAKFPAERVGGEGNGEFGHARAAEMSDDPFRFFGVGRAREVDVVVGPRTGRDVGYRPDKGDPRFDECRSGCGRLDVGITGIAEQYIDAVDFDQVGGQFGGFGRIALVIAGFLHDAAAVDAALRVGVIEVDLGTGKIVAADFTPEAALVEDLPDDDVLGCGMRVGQKAGQRDDKRTSKGTGHWRVREGRYGSTD